MGFSVSKTSENVRVPESRRFEPAKVQKEEPKLNLTAENNHPTAFLEKQTVNAGDWRKTSLQLQMNQTQSAEANKQPIQAGLVRDSATSPYNSVKAQEVAKLQDKLIELGHLKSEEVGKNRGHFGPKTENAVKSFQQNNNLPVTGRVDQATADALNNAKPATAPASGANSATGTAKTVEEANKYHIVQFRHEKFNPDGPKSSSDCGPASLEMALQAAGIKTDVDPSQNNARVIESRKDMGKYEAGVPQEKQPTTSTVNITKGANAAIARARANGTLGANEGSAEIVSKKGTWESMDAALNSGKTVVLAGDISPKYREANGFTNNGSNKNYGRSEGGHFVAVLGKSANGNYIVSDPLSMNGAKEMTKEQLATFTKNPTDYVAISGKPAATTQAPEKSAPATQTSPNAQRPNDFNAQQIADIINKQAPKGSPLRGAEADKLAAHIVAESERTGVPAWLTVAQMRFENSFGNPADGFIKERPVYNANGEVARNDGAHNLFGLSGKNPTTGEYVTIVHYKNGKEVGKQNFQAFKTWEESVSAYTKNASEKYKNLSLHDYIEKYFPKNALGNSPQRQNEYISVIKQYAAQAGVELTDDTILIK